MMETYVIQVGKRKRCATNEEMQLIKEAQVGLAKLPNVVAPVDYYNKLNELLIGHCQAQVVPSFKIKTRCYQFFPLNCTIERLVKSRENLMPKAVATKAEEALTRFIALETDSFKISPSWARDGVKFNKQVKDYMAEFRLMVDEFLFIA
jgi:hypothetical protein